MAIFRVEKTSNYTVMSNHHLRDIELSLKAKGLLSQILSLPPNWDYTLVGLSRINRESLDAIRSAVQELENAGYITRSRERKENGQLGGADYIIREIPLNVNITPDKIVPPPVFANPASDKPTSENPTQVNSALENPTQLSKEVNKNKDLLTTDTQNTDSIHSPAPLSDQHENEENLKRTECNRTEAESAFNIYRAIIRENIDYPELCDRHKYDRDRINELVDLMLETICTARKTIRIASDDYPAEVVKAKFLKLDSEHISFVLDCMKENTTKIRNIKKYLLTALFNAPSTIGSYYTSLVAHDMANGLLTKPGKNDSE